MLGSSESRRFFTLVAALSFAATASLHGAGILTSLAEAAFDPEVSVGEALFSRSVPKA